MVCFAPVVGALLTWHRDCPSTEDVCVRVLCVCCFHLLFKAWHWFSGVWLFIILTLSMEIHIRL